MNKVSLKTIIAAFTLILGGCSAFVPSNYLSPNTIQQPQKVNNKSIKPNLIFVNASLLSTPSGKALLESAMKPQAYRVGSYDYLNVIVWGHPEFSTLSSAAILPGAQAGVPTSSNPTIVVDAEGDIFFPYVGDLHVSGLTVKEIQSVIANRLSQYIRTPQVTVQVAKFRNRSIYVLGEVKKPDMHPLTDKPLTLMEALSMSGGIDPSNADPTHIYLVRGSYVKPDIFWIDATVPQNLMIAQQFALQENDVVYVSSASLSGWNRFINQVLPTLMTYTLVKNIDK